MDSGLAHFAQILERKLGKDLKDFPGTGAAGGLGYGIMLFLKGTLERGVDIVTRLTLLSEKMTGSDLVITGEGKIDFQTIFGKTPIGVAELAMEKNIPIIVIAGSLGEGYEKLYEKGFDGIFSIIDKPMSLDEALDNTEQLLANMTESIIRFWISSK